MEIKERRKVWKLRYRLKDPERARRQNTKHCASYRNRHPEVVERINKKKRDNISTLRMEMGGKCAHCGYDDEIRILHFHHTRDKKFNLSRKIVDLDKMRSEAKKCILLCPNCHALVHLK